MAERLLPKQKVVGSNPISRSTKLNDLSRSKIKVHGRLQTELFLRLSLTPANQLPGLQNMLEAGFPLIHMKAGDEGTNSNRAELSAGEPV